MNIFVARHGQTVLNEQNKVCGTTDIDLTEKGIEQAHQLAANIKCENINLIFSSPLKRAVSTGKIVSEQFMVPLLTDKRLIEQNYGIYEGTDRKNTDFLRNKRNFAFKYPDGESMMHVAYRVYGFIDEIKQTHTDKNILIISHGGVCRVIHTYFCDMTNEEFYNFTLKNGETMKYVV